MDKKNLFQRFYGFSQTPQYQKSRRLIAKILRANDHGKTIDYDDMAAALHTTRDEVDKLVAGMTKVDMSLYSPAMEYVDTIIES